MRKVAEARNMRLGNNEYVIQSNPDQQKPVDMKQPAPPTVHTSSTAAVKTTQPGAIPPPPPLPPSAPQPPNRQFCLGHAPTSGAKRVPGTSSGAQGSYMMAELQARLAQRNAKDESNKSGVTAPQAKTNKGGQKAMNGVNQDALRDQFAKRRAAIGNDDTDLSDDEELSYGGESEYDFKGHNPDDDLKTSATDPKPEQELGRPIALNLAKVSAIAAKLAAAGQTSNNGNSKKDMLAQIRAGVDLEKLINNLVKQGGVEMPLLKIHYCNNYKMRLVKWY